MSSHPLGEDHGHWGVSFSRNSNDGNRQPDGTEVEPRRKDQREQGILFSDRISKWLLDDGDSTQARLNGLSQKHRTDHTLLLSYFETPHPDEKVSRHSQPSSSHADQPPVHGLGTTGHNCLYISPQLALSVQSEELSTIDEEPSSLFVQPGSSIGQPLSSDSKVAEEQSHGQLVADELAIDLAQLAITSAAETTNTPVGILASTASSQRRLLQRRLGGKNASTWQDSGIGDCSGPTTSSRHPSVVLSSSNSHVVAGQTNSVSDTRRSFTTDTDERAGEGSQEKRLLNEEVDATDQEYASRFSLQSAAKKQLVQLICGNIHASLAQALADAQQVLADLENEQASYSGSDLQSNSQLGQGSHDSSKRRDRNNGPSKRAANDHDDHGEGDSDDSQPPQKPGKGRPRMASPRAPHIFACPYIKKCPAQCNQVAGCIRLGTIRQHLYRKHLLYECVSCKERFSSTDQLTKHNKLTSCDERDRDEQQRNLERCAGEIRRVTGMPDHEKWLQIYHILFPEEKRSEHPTPYHHNHEQRDRNIHEQRLEYQACKELVASIDAVVDTELPKRLAKQLKGLALLVEANLVVLPEEVLAEMIETCTQLTANNRQDLSKPQAPEVSVASQEGRPAKRVKLLDEETAYHLAERSIPPQFTLVNSDLYSLQSTGEASPVEYDMDSGYYTNQSSWEDQQSQHQDLEKLCLVVSHPAPTMNTMIPGVSESSTAQNEDGLEYLFNYPFDPDSSFTCVLE